MNNKSRSKDINYIFLRNNKFKKIARSWVYNKVFFIFLLILIQILLFIFALLKLNPYLEYVLGSSIFLSAVFMIYITNKQGKNEFKLAWTLPFMVFPLFGIAAYIFYHANFGGMRLKKNLSEAKKLTANKKVPASDNLDEYENIKGLAQYLKKTGGFEAHCHNGIEYFPNGESLFPQLFKDIQEAKEFIFLEFFIIDVDESWTLLLELLEEKVKQGVEVRVLYDAIGSIMAATKKYAAFLRSKGIQTQVFSPLIPFFSTHLNNRNHRKIVVVDGKVAYTGGINIANEYFNYGKNRFNYWKDNMVRITGSAISNLTTMFIQDWNIQNCVDKNPEKYIYRDYDFVDKKGVVIPYGDDAFNDEDLAENIYLEIINNAKKYIHITTPYLVIDNHLQDSLLFAIRKGIELSIILPARPDHLITFCIGKTYIKTLIEAGANVYIYDKGFIHAKTFISDDETATVGSVNLDYRSFYYHFECGAFMYRVDEIADIERDFQETLKDCTKMTIENYKKTPKRYRILGRLFRIFGPLV